MSAFRESFVQSSVGLTREIAARAAGTRYASLPVEVHQIARLCLLDWLGVTLAGSREPLARILQAEFASGGGATVIGSRLTASALDAALINGSASHAQDYDDFHLAMPAHPTAAMMPAVFALAETEGASGSRLIEAFVAAYETACRIGLIVAPSHYGRGFHSTGTLCALGAAAGCARLLNLDAETTAHAIGIAATQCGGLKASFGTMCKPLHAGRASYVGLFAARAAKRGFRGRDDIVECEQGFAETMSSDFHPEAGLAEPSGGYHILGNVFKHHAACGATHSAIEASRVLRDTHGVRPETVRRITVRVDPKCDRICNIPNPNSGLEAKFSLRQTVALALAGHETADPTVYSDELARDAGLRKLRERIQVEFLPVPAEESILQLYTEVAAELTDGRSFIETFDVSRPSLSEEKRQQRIEEKFYVLARDEINATAAQRVVQLSGSLDSLPDIKELAACCIPS